jgi:hypothetical protein
VARRSFRFRVDRDVAARPPSAWLPGAPSVEYLCHLVPDEFTRIVSVHAGHEQFVIGGIAVAYGRCDGELERPVLSDGSLRIESRRTAAHALSGLAGSAEHSVLDELAADRRDPAAAEAEAERSGRPPSAGPGSVRSR